MPTLNITFKNQDTKLKLFEVLGEGAQSIVYRGLLEGSKEKLAVKVYPKSVINNDDIQKRLFKNEYENIRQQLVVHVITFIILFVMVTSPL